MLVENGIDYSDFFSYINNNLGDALIIEMTEKIKVINVIYLFARHLALKINSSLSFLYNINLLNNFKMLVETHFNKSTMFSLLSNLSISIK